MIFKHRPEILLFLAAVLALASFGYAKGIVGNQVWTTDPDYSFGLQVMLPRIGLIISSFISACGAFAIAEKYSQSPDNLIGNSKKASMIMFAIGLGLLISGYWRWETEYQLIYSIFGPALIGYGMYMFIHSLKWLKNKVAAVSISVIFLIPAFALASMGEPSPFDVWQFLMVLNGGSALFILMAALSGSFIMNERLR